MTHQFFIVGGSKTSYLYLQKRLEAAGAKTTGHWERSIRAHPKVPSRTTAILLVSDYCSHVHSNAAKKDARDMDIPLVYGSQHWTRTKLILEKEGMLMPPTAAAQVVAPEPPAPEVAPEPVSAPVLEMVHPMPTASEPEITTETKVAYARELMLAGMPSRKALAAVKEKFGTGFSTTILTTLNRELGRMRARKMAQAVETQAVPSLPEISRLSGEVRAALTLLEEACQNSGVDEIRLFKRDGKWVRAYKVTISLEE